MKIFLKKFPEKVSTISPEIPDKMIPIPTEISHSVIIETTFCDNPNNAPNIATATIIQITTLNFSI